MITCSRCGELNSDTRESCFHCGARFSTRTTPMQKHCPQCGEKLVTKRRDCPSCGEPLQRGYGPAIKEETPIAEYLFPEVAETKAIIDHDWEKVKELRRRQVTIGLIAAPVVLLIVGLIVLLGG